MFDGDLLSERARVTPDRLALVSVETGERLTYGQLNERAERAAGALQELAVQAGDRFGLLAHNSIDFLAYFFAAGKIAAIVVPLSTRATAHELKHVIADCGMKMLMYGPEFEATALDCGGPAAALKAAAELPHSKLSNPEDTYALLYTSGTTGKPKG